MKQWDASDQVFKIDPDFFDWVIIVASVTCTLSLRSRIARSMAGFYRE